MSKRLTNREKLLSKLNNFSENEIGELLRYAMTMERVRRQDGVTDAIPQTSDDELLMMLSAARENRRARQVFEWESVRRRVEGKGSVHWRH
jgi:hypothetical protein